MDYIGRSAWGARYAAGFGPRPLPCTEAWLHHTVTKHLHVTASEAEEREQMRQVEAIGQRRFGAGFSYNLAIFPSGRVYVGCGVRRVGAHTAGRNTRALGIVLVGNYERYPVSNVQQAAVEEVLRDAHRLGWLTAPRLNGGHRDLKATACPGAHAYRLIPEMNRNAAGTPPAPDPTPTPLSQTGPDMIIVLAPDNRRQFVCDKDTARHIGMPERNVLIAGGVPYVGGDQASADDRAEFLSLRGVQ